MEYSENYNQYQMTAKTTGNVDKNTVINYLSIAKEKEAEIYALHRLIQRIQEKIHSIYSAVTIERDKIAAAHKSYTTLGVIIVIWEFLGFNLIAGAIEEKEPSLFFMIALFFGTPLLMLAILVHSYLRNKKKIKELQEDADDRAAILQMQIKKVEMFIESKTNALNAFYSDYNMIYPKYRHFVAVSTIWEYLVSERCDSLIGPNGAYNIFENEVRLNRIVSNLDDISKTLQNIANILEQIKCSQFALYEAITGAELYIDNMQSDIDNLGKDEEYDIIEKIRRNSFSL